MSITSIIKALLLGVMNNYEPSTCCFPFFLGLNSAPYLVAHPCEWISSSHKSGRLIKVKRNFLASDAMKFLETW